MSTYLIGPLLVLLPESYRRWLGGRLNIDWTRAALVSGLVQMLLCGVLLFIYYLDFMDAAVGQLGELALKAGREEVVTGRPGQVTLGLMALLQFLFQPLTLLLVYFAVEGSARLLAAFFAEQAIGSLPLYLLELGRARGAKVKRELAQAPLVADEVTHSGQELRIASCRRRDAWDHLMTIEYEGEFYELAEMTVGRPPRPFVYRLRPMPPGKIIRGLHHYRPDELLPPEKAAPKGSR